MISDIKKYVEILVDNDITPEQFLFLYLRVKNDKESYLKYCPKGEFKFTNQELDDLEDKGYIISNRQVGSGHLWDQIVVSPAFEEMLFINDRDAALELWNCYPKLIKVNNITISARNYPYEEFISEYSKIIRGDKFLHSKILNITKKVLQKNPEFNTGLKKYIDCRMWEAFEEQGYNDSIDHV